MTLSKEELSGLAGAHAMTEREVSSERVSEDFVEQVAKEIAKHTYARCLPQMSDCEDWDAMEEADRKIYRSAAAAALALRSSVKTVGVLIQPLETRPQGEDVMEPSEIEVHEGAWALVMGTNAKAAGWIDTHALFAHQLYRDQILPTSSIEAPAEASEVTEDAVFRAMTKADDPDIALCDDDAREILVAALKGDRP